MKKNTVLICVALACTAVLAAGCRQGVENVDWSAAIEAFDAATAEVDEDMYQELILKTYREHPADSLGLYAVGDLFRVYWPMDKVEEELKKADTLISNNANIKKWVALRYKQEETAPGTPFKDIDGTDPVTGQVRKLSDYAGKGKPVIVDFWASWCPPCRAAIKDHMVDFYASRSEDVEIVGIAVWEDGPEDTIKAMSELGVSWPVVYTGGREDSPSAIYGVVGIPTLVVLSPDGIIKYRGYEIEEALAALDN